MATRCRKAFRGCERRSATGTSGAMASSSTRTREAIVTIGSKEGLAHLMLACLERGDTVLVPNPSLPDPHLRRDHRRRRHPLGAHDAGRGFLRRARARDPRAHAEAEDADPRLPVESDRAMRRSRVSSRRSSRSRSSTTSWSCTTSPTPTSCSTADKAPSIMQVPGARDVAVEFFTMSKSYNMAGWRIGFMVGNKRAGARARRASRATTTTAASRRSRWRPSSRWKARRTASRRSGPPTRSGAT